jgi:hypothetical protein
VFIDSCAVRAIQKRWVALVEANLTGCGFANRNQLIREAASGQIEPF